MTKLTPGRWLLVAIAILGLAFAATVVSAHGPGTPADDAPPYDGTAEEWAVWMETHMTEHVGPGWAEWMETHMGISVEEMAEHMADGDHDGPHGDDHRGDGPHGDDHRGGHGSGMGGYGGHGGGC